MNQQDALRIFLILQATNIIFVLMEWKTIKKGLENISYKLFLGRLFIFLLPALAILSILIRPLEGN